MRKAQGTGRKVGKSEKNRLIGLIGPIGSVGWDKTD